MAFQEDLNLVLTLYKRSNLFDILVDSDAMMFLMTVMCLISLMTYVIDALMTATQMMPLTMMLMIPW